MTDACQITWGPLSILTALLIVRDSPYRHPVQALVSTGHVYGDTLYFATTVFDEFYSGKVYYRPEPFYFWVYFVLMNAIWLVIPGCKITLSVSLYRDVGLLFIDCLYSSIKATTRAFSASKVNAVESTKKKL
jgi:cholestenol delta-isomerase